MNNPYENASKNGDSGLKHFEKAPTATSNLSILNKELSIYSSLLTTNKLTREGGTTYKHYARSVNVNVGDGLAYALWDYKSPKAGKQNEIHSTCQDFLQGLTAKGLHATEIIIANGKVSVRASTSTGEEQVIDVLTISDHWKDTSEGEIRERLETSTSTANWVNNYTGYTMSTLIAESSQQIRENAGIDGDGEFLVGSIMVNGQRHAVFKRTGSIATLVDQNGPESPFSYRYHSLDFLHIKLAYLKRQKMAYAQVERAIEMLEN